MKIFSYRYKRMIWLFLILLISLGLVGIALAAAGREGRSVNDVVSAAPQAQGGVQPVQSLPPSPITASTQPPLPQSRPDLLFEQMRLQAMADSKTANLSASPEDINRIEFWNTPSGLTYIWGGATPNQPITITTSSGDLMTAWADGDGNFSADHGTYLYPGDLVTATDQLGLYSVTVMLPVMLADADSSSNLVYGEIGYYNQDMEIYPWWGEPMTTTVSDDTGKYSVLFNDIPPMGNGNIRFVINLPPYDVQAIFHRPFYDYQLYIQANYGQDWVEQQYDPGYEAWITITNDLGELKATAHGVTSEIPWWGGHTGLSTNHNVTWDGIPPDLVAGDFVYVLLDNGLSNVVQLGEIGGVVDIAADTFEGFLDIPWLTGTVPVGCGLWVPNGPGIGVGEIDPNGGTFTCDFGGLGWDVLPGMDLAVDYRSVGNQVLNVFNVPAPHLWINLETWGDPTYGNNFVLRVHYNNDGLATAPDVTISQEFVGMTYLSDTSGFNHSGSGAPGDPIIWDVGDLTTNRISDRSFFVFVSIDDPLSVSSNGNIDTSLAYFQWDEGSKSFSWSAGVVENTSDPEVGMGAWTWAPIAGEKFVYAVNVCNNHSTNTSEIYITDTLPLSTTLVDWWGQIPGWEEVSASEHELVVKRPTASAYQCNEVYINVLLDERAPVDWNLHNEARIWASSDTNMDNNFAAMDHPVGKPEYNLHLSPNWVQGKFVPGGEVGFEFSFSNWGNMPVSNTHVTSTLPGGVKFLYAYTWDWTGWKPYTPTITTDEYLVWDIGEFLNGYNTNVGFRVLIPADAQPGTPLDFVNTIMGDALEFRYDDNVLTFHEKVNENGPNLRVDKHTNWWWNGWNGQLRYELRILNVGTKSADNPMVVDTYPVSTTATDCGWNHGPIQSCEIDEVDHVVRYYMTRFNPGETASAMVTVDLITDVIGTQGLAFVNQVDISDFGDIDLSDNHDEVTSYTGPDVFVRKWLKEGELRPGELITFTVEFGNQNRWPWNGDWGYNSHITDTLPAGLSFVRAIRYWEPDTLWEPESIHGHQVAWNFGTIWAESTWTFDLVVQIDNDVPLGQELVNVVEAWGDSPTDIEVNTDNNRAEYSLSIVEFRILMPLTQRSP